MTVTKYSKFVCTGPIDEVATEILQPFGEIFVAPDLAEESLLSLLDGTIGLVVRGQGNITARIIEAANDLKVIGRTGVGYNNVDITAATARKIPVVYTPGANAQAVAEAALALMLTLTKKVFFWDQQLKQGNWKSREQTKPGDLDGATLGIIGFGNIGQKLAELMGPFNMEILAFDPCVSVERAKSLNTKLVDLDVLLKRSDFISLHAPLMEQTKGLINSERLKLVKPGAYLVNLARGGLIESLDVLYDAVKKGILAGVGLDVFDPEPPNIAHPIFKLPNCITAPHSLGMTPRAMGNIFKSMAMDMSKVLKGERPRFVVNPEIYG